MTIELSLGREVLAAALLVLMAGSSLVVAWAVVPRLIGRDPLLRALVGALVVLAQPIGLCLLLAMLGALWLPVVVGAHVVLAAGVLWRLGVPDAWSSAAPDGRRAWGTAAVVGASAAYVALGSYLSLTGGRSREFDTQDYHLANLATWLRTGDLWTLPYAQPGSVTATHPSNGELLATWLALPTHGDELVYLVPTAFAILAILAMAVLVRELRPDEAWAPLAGAAAGLAVLLAPGYFVQMDSLNTDVVAASGILTAVALLLVARRDGATKLVVLAGVALGLGLGSKYTAVVPTAVVTVAAVVLLGSVRRVLWLLPGGLALAGPWFVRNLVIAGNPLFPQDLKVFEGSQTPYDLLNTSMLNHLVEGDTAIVASWARLGGRYVGPVFLLVALGVVVAVARGRRAEPGPVALVVAGVTLATFVGYLATPVTGGGPTGIEFIITSCFRYGLPAVLLGAALGTAMVGRRAATALLGLILAWDLWRVTGDPLPGRPDIDLSARPLAVAVAAGILGAAVVLVGRSPVTIPPTWRRVVLPAAAVGLASFGAWVAIHHNDRGRTLTELEAVLVGYGPTTPVVPVGVVDLRALLGPRLERPLVRVSRGGAAEEIPFADENQLRRRVLGDVDAPLPPPELAAALDAAVDATGVDLLVVGLTSPLGFPDGWLPGPDWCVAGGDAEGTLFVRAERLPAGATCTTATELVGPEGGSS